MDGNNLLRGWYCWYCGICVGELTCYRKVAADTAITPINEV